jgi:hypothetical protein
MRATQMNPITLSNTDAGRRRSAFEQIYHAHLWQGSSRSGPGSDPHNTTKYIEFIQNWLASHPDVRTVVEVGCGDWSTSSKIGFGATHRYIGIDIVKSNIDNNTIKYGTNQIDFIHSDFIEEPPPFGDLLIAKDVLQHLSNISILTFIRCRPVEVGAAPFNLAIAESLLYKNVLRTSPTKIVYTKQIAVCPFNSVVQATI